MTVAAIAVCVGCQLLLVAGQLLLKRAMGGKVIRTPMLAAGIALLAAWFFLWLGLLARWDLSRLFPFEGLNPALVMAGSAVFLRERFSTAAWCGVVLIGAGIAIVAAS